ncbi:(deoxy)nucleoside triphosphate pyrophosphohydrolase [Schlesneria paludicola]|uniref:(deoxy)nucleoside triphosphate pyrophosphohydrolase n=1 Tax=Schlesneria paludicola TaxID=360056 RepID=UPI00029ACAD7|nr:(deoxy)nucleoside triphosphate pyrophosphohydrolase [Schlesneria paludicola]
MTATKRIGIAIVEHAGQYLVGTRGPDGPLPGYAEFPGGKCLPDETPSDCAIRECLEESGLPIAPEKLLQQLEFEYPHGRVHLHFYLCHPEDAKSVSDRHQGFRWVELAELTTLKFPEANADVVKMLVRESNES